MRASAFLILSLSYLTYYISFSNKSITQQCNHHVDLPKELKSRLRERRATFQKNNPYAKIAERVIKIRELYPQGEQHGGDGVDQGEFPCALFPPVLRRPQTDEFHESGGHRHRCVAAVQEAVHVATPRRSDDRLRRARCNLGNIFLHQLLPRSVTIDEYIADPLIETFTRCNLRVYFIYLFRRFAKGGIIIILYKGDSNISSSSSWIADR